MKKIIARIFGLYTKEEYSQEADARDKAESIIRSCERDVRFGHPMSLTTGSLDGLFLLIEDEFNRIEKDYNAGKEINPRLEILREYAQEYYSLEFIPSNRLLISSGTEGGTRQTGSIRINRRSSEETASQEAYVKNLIRKYHPDLTMFTVSSGAFEFSRWFRDSRRLLQRLPSGEAEKAPMDIILKHLGQALDLTCVRPDLIYHKENYGKKWAENLISLSMHMNTIRPQTICSISDIIKVYEKNATIPFWDRSLEDAKYNDAGEIRQFDFTKVNALVIPAYEPVQIAVEYGNCDHIKEFKAIAKSKFDDIDVLWELGMLYSLSRRMHRSIVKCDWKRFDETLDLAVAQRFDTVKQGNMLIDDMKRYRDMREDA